MSTIKRSDRNRTIVLTAQDRAIYKNKLTYLTETLPEATNITINQDMFSALSFLPKDCIDLLILDPPYNLSKDFGNMRFTKLGDADYEVYINNIISALYPMLKETASVYFCCDWQTSPLAYNVCRNYFKVRNRITWEREKGRGAKFNWKNNLEDIWFFTVSDDYTFNSEALKIKRRVIAPYKQKGQPKDWAVEENEKIRLTFHSNIWTDITVPFWSMSENTDHSCQKAEKLVAKMILASSDPGDLVLDPFLGSGTTSVVSKKLNRNYLGIEQNEDYCLLAEKRLAMAAENTTIQGLKNGIFLDRNLR